MRAPAPSSLRYWATACLWLWLGCGATLAHADLAIMVSDDKPSMVNVAQAIAARYEGRVHIHQLSGDRKRGEEIASSISHSNVAQVVSIGLLASQIARQRLSSKQVVFCQVLNYEDMDLVTPWMKGVSAIPALSKQFSTWRLLNPNLRRIGAITGTGMKSLMDEARASAKAQQLDLTVAQAGSDREVLLNLKRMGNDIQGLWLVPDSSILSSAIIKEIMAYCVKQQIQVLAFSPSLLQEGGLLSAVADPDDIATQVVTRLRQSSSAPVASLSNARMNVNAKVAELLGLALSEKFKEAIRVP